MMKKISRLLLAAPAAGLLLIAAGAGAQDRPAGPRVEVNRGGVRVDVAPLVRPAVPPVKVSDMIGLRVYNGSNEDLGKIEDLVMDPSAGKIRYAVLSFGGFLGMGDKLFAVPWDDLKLVPKGTTSVGTASADHYVLDMSKDALKQAPGFDKSKWPDFANQSWSADVDRFYNSQRVPAGSR